MSTQGDRSAEGGDMGKAPAFQFYAADFLMGTSDMTAEEVGIYIRLLASSWDKGPLPVEPSRLARVAGVEIRKFVRAWATVRSKWIETPDGYINERLELQRQERERFAELQAERGRRSGESRRTKREPETNQRSSAVRTGDEPETNRGRTLRSSVFDLRSSDQDPKDTHTAPAATVAPLIDGRSIRLHAQHAWCSLPREGLCIPPFLHAEFLGKSQRTDAELRTWYRGVVDRFDGVGIGEDSLTFWRNQLALWIGTVTSKPGRGDKTTRALDAVEEAIRLSQLDQKAVGDGRG